MAKTPDFEKITDTITQADIDRFLKSAGPADFKDQVREATDQRTRMRFVAGYLIRTRQITPDRLNGKLAAAGTSEKVKTSRARTGAKAAQVQPQQQAD